MATPSITATVARNDAKVATHYDMKAGEALLGKAEKNDKGEFVFTAADGVAIDEITSKTMRDLKQALASKVPPGLAKAAEAKPGAKPNGAAQPKQATAKPPSPKLDPALDPATAEEAGDLDLT
jgi:hypothetical protein